MFDLEKYVHTLYNHPRIKKANTLSKEEQRRHFVCLSRDFCTKLLDGDLAGGQSGGRDFKK